MQPFLRREKTIMKTIGFKILYRTESKEIKIEDLKKLSVKKLKDF